MLNYLNQIDILDETWVTEVTEAIDDNRIDFSIQGVHSIEKPEIFLYGECLARFQSKDGNPIPAGDFVPLLDVWNKAPLLDRHVLTLVLNELEADSRAVLGSNISIDSLNKVSEWNKTKDILEQHRHLLPRLILEITECKPLSDMVTMARWLAEVKELGCRVAIDNFGSGHVAPNQLLAMDVDIIKIDARCVQNIRPSRIGGNNLLHMVGLAACSAPIVVVEGIETGQHLQMARLAGATHAQGYYLSIPFNLNTGESDPWANRVG